MPKSGLRVAVVSIAERAVTQCRSGSRTSASGGVWEMDCSRSFWMSAGTRCPEDPQGTGSFFTNCSPVFLDSSVQRTSPPKGQQIPFSENAQPHLTVFRQFQPGPSLVNVYGIVLEARSKKSSHPQQKRRQVFGFVYLEEIHVSRFQKSLARQMARRAD
jgi:hypothetical protein